MITLMVPLQMHCSKQQRLFNEVEKKRHSAVTPVEQTNPEVTDWWGPRHEAINARLAQGNAGLLFVGNSITHCYESAGIDVWNEYYAHRNAVNMGCGWDRTQHLLWRLDHTDFSNVRPKLAVLLIGTNNCDGDLNTPEEIADGIILNCKRLRDKLPDTKILLLAIFPRDSLPSPVRAKAAEASRLASRIADGKTIIYMDIGSVFLGDNGRISLEIMPDYLHPNEAGYRLWAEAIEPKVKEFLRE